MVSADLFVMDKSVSKWLNHFFKQAEPGRLNRGVEIYQSGNVESFQERAYGFTATVQGSESYSVSAFFEGVDRAGLPELNDTLFICSCPDSHHYCKHVVAGAIKWAERTDDKATVQRAKRRNPQLGKTLSPHVETGLEKLERLARSELPPDYTRTKGPVWPFDPPLSKIMEEIQTVVSRHVRGKG